MLRRLRDRFHSPTSSPSKCGSSSSHSGMTKKVTSPTAASTGSFPNRDGMTLAAAAAAEVIAAASFAATLPPPAPAPSPPAPPHDGTEAEEPQEEAKEEEQGQKEAAGANPHRSVNDYVSADDLRRALRSSASDEDEDDADAGSSCSSCSSASASSPPSPSTRPTEMAWFFARNERAVRRLLRATSKEEIIGRGNGGDGGGDGGCEATKQEATTTAATTTPDPDTDWVLQDYDAETTDPNKLSLEHELRRLLVLKSFLILDQQQQQPKQPQKEGGPATRESETGFDDITELARTTFRCPISTIGMVDLGRQWFLSKRGLDAAPRSFPRKLTFCQHAIASTRPILIVPDTALDARFCDNPVVTGPPHLRFYAGCSLVSPEGYRIGTLCIMDTKPRPPPGLNPDEQETLLNLASTTVTKLVQHRTKMSIWFNNLVTTHYPDLSREEEAAKSLLMAPDDSDEANEEEDEEDNKREEEGGGGEENENNQQQQQQVEDDSRICEDEDDKDFAAFLENTKQMSLEDLIRLLQRQAREQQAQRRREEGNGPRGESSQHAEEGEGGGSATQVQEGGEGEEGVGEAEESKQQPPPTEEGGGDRIVLQKRTSSEEKRFRFAVNARVYEIESHKGIKEQWWSADEMYEIRSERKQTAQYFRKYRQDYIQSLKYILKYACTEQRQHEGEDDDEHDHDNDEDTKRVALNTFLRRLMTRQSEQARGLESHIVRQIRDHQKRLVVAVLDEQDEGKAACDDSDTMWNMIRDQSLTYSEQSTRFAFNLAQVDRIQALKEATAGTTTTTTAENKKQKQKDSTARQPCRQPSLKERLLNATSPRQPFRRPSFSEHADDPVA